MVKNPNWQEADQLRKIVNANAAFFSQLKYFNKSSQRFFFLLNWWQQLAIFSHTSP